jgi:sigma-B regulation protein RsbQ
MHRQMPKSVLRVIKNVGHCPHMSAASDSFDAMHGFLTQMLS